MASITHDSCLGVLGIGCEAVAAFCRRLVNGAAELSRADIMTGKNVKSEGKVDLNKQSTGKRRMRVDEDRREEVAVGSVEKKRATTSDQQLSLLPLVLLMLLA